MHLAPQAKDWHVVWVQVEDLAAVRDSAALASDGRQPLDATQLARIVGVWLRLWRDVTVILSQIKFFGGQQLGQPPQFPERPLALLACR